MFFENDVDTSSQIEHRIRVSFIAMPCARGTSPIFPVNLHPCTAWLQFERTFQIDSTAAYTIVRLHRPPGIYFSPRPLHDTHHVTVTHVIGAFQVGNSCISVFWETETHFATFPNFVFARWTLLPNEKVIFRMHMFLHWAPEGVLKLLHRVVRRFNLETIKTAFKVASWNLQCTCCYDTKYSYNFLYTFQKHIECQILCAMTVTQLFSNYLHSVHPLFTNHERPLAVI